MHVRSAGPFQMRMIWSRKPCYALQKMLIAISQDEYASLALDYDAQPFLHKLLQSSARAHRSCELRVIDVPSQAGPGVEFAGSADFKCVTRDARALSRGELVVSVRLMGAGLSGFHSHIRGHTGRVADLI